MRYSTFRIHSSTCRIPSKLCIRHGLADSIGMADTDSIGTDDIAGDSDSTTDDTARVADGGDGVGVVVGGDCRGRGVRDSKFKIPNSQARN